MTELFDDLHWHDAEILCISLDRRNPGYIDDVIIEVCWPDGNIQKLIFSHCFAFEAKMNFNIVARETIRMAFSTEECIEIDEIIENWKFANLDLKQLRCFVIETNSTASTLKIISMGFNVV